MSKSDLTMRDSRQTVALIMLVVLVMVAIIGNIFGTIFFFEGTRIFWPIFFVALGLLVAQPCLLSIWCALGNERGIWRIPAAMGIVLLLLAIYLKTMEMLDDSIPWEVIIAISAITLAISLILQIPLWIFRQTTKQVIQLPTDADALLASNQFGIKHLLITTTLVAIVLAFVTNAFPESSFQGGTPAGIWMQLILFLVFFICISCLLTFLALAAIFFETKRGIYLVLLSLFLLFCPLASIQFIRSFAGMLFGPIGFGVTEVVNTYLFVWSLAAGILGIMWIFYFIGYRLKKKGSGVISN